MKSLTILVAIILFSSYATARDLESAASLGDEKFGFPFWWHYPYFPYYHPKPYWPIPTVGKALPPTPAVHPNPPPFPFHPPPVVVKCLSDCKDVRACVADIVKAFFTRKPALETDCCASIMKMDEDCDKTLFGAYHNPWFDYAVKIHCSTKAKPTPSAPSPA